MTGIPFVGGITVTRAFRMGSAVPSATTRPLMVTDWEAEVEISPEDCGVPFALFRLNRSTFMIERGSACQRTIHQRLWRSL
jgi:hypothetical protein